MAHRSSEQDCRGEEGTAWKELPWRKLRLHPGLQQDLQGLSLGGDRSPSSTEDANTGRARNRTDSIGSSTLEQMKNLALHAQEERQRRSSLNIRRRAAVPLGLAWIALLVFAAFVFRSAFVRGIRGQDAHQDDGCTSRGCQEHLELLSRSLDPAVNPCVDPAAYVCKKVRWISQLGSDAYIDTMAGYYERGTAFLARQRKPARTQYFTSSNWLSKFA
ncbi:uncharacterized protein LOC144101320 [Amblyomma americanum]